MHIRSPIAALVALALSPVGVPPPASARNLVDVSQTKHRTKVVNIALSPGTRQLTTAAHAFRWGKPVARDEFNYTGAPKPRKWSVYDSVGHGGNGIRSPAAWYVNGAVARVTGDSSGTTGGMAALFGHRKYGRWETKMRTNARDREYHPVALLWPDSGDWPCGGEIDYAEGTTDVTEIHFYLHYSCSNLQTSTTKGIDTTRWHAYAVQWTPNRIVGYIDGVRWFRDSKPSHLPPGRMHQTLQLDWFPDATATTTSWMEIAWVRVYDAPTA